MIVEPSLAPELVGEMPNPYVGLRAFDVADTDRFFGRDRLVSQIVERLDGTDISSRCVVVVGPSGSGKSTFLRTVATNLVLAYAGGPVVAQDRNDHFFHETHSEGLTGGNEGFLWNN